eukprot:CAMPEP_0180246938 /NCGR_PEP_ID=MMETSP0987-20121128/35852_1 /TAXON_ID=697907 /ORGANISM="non described non described, Strain CCMP2293" /LENGTH=50 /DNA_ID=CAMNT_0022214809 /DNA_START=65 /DNA_END=214 /DNA_ORIENTATION=-
MRMRLSNTRLSYWRAQCQRRSRRCGLVEVGAGCGGGRSGLFQALRMSPWA